MVFQLRYCISLLLVVSTASAQFYYFGRNKVQYTDFKWHVLRTEHFDIYYYPEMKELAQTGAAFAEQSYRELEQKFNHNVSNRIPLIFYSSHLHFQQTNVTPGFIPEGVGGFFEFLKGRVVIPFEGSIERFGHVIKHELVHVFMHSKINRVLLDYRQPQDRAVPLWFAEGLAEFWSTVWDTQAEMVLRDAVLNNYVVPLNDIDRISGSFLMYKEGQAILEFIAERYGREKILLLLENFWRGKTFQDVFVATLGKDYKQFDGEWLYYLKKRFYPAMAHYDLPSGVTRNVVDVGFNSKPVFYRKNGTRQVYFIGNHTGYTNIYRVDPDGEKPDPVVVVEGEKSDEFEAFHLFQSKLGISAAGVLAFVTKSGENDALHLYDLAKDELIETLRFRSLVMLSSPSFSPDGQRIAFSGIDKSGHSDLYIFELNSRTLVRLTDDFYEDRDPAWSPDGSLIAFSSDRGIYGRHGKHNIFLFNLSTSRIDYLTEGDHTDLSPVWSAEGSWLAFTSDIDGARNIWLTRMVEDGKKGTPRLIKRVTNFSTAAFDPAWGEGAEMFFTAFEKFGFQIKTVADVATLYDSSQVSRLIVYDHHTVHWTAPKLDGPAVVEEFRYAGDYKLDIAQSQVSTDPVFGTAGGAILAMSDVLGNDQYYFLIYNTAQTRGEFLESFNIAISRLSLSRRANYAYGIFHFSGNRYDLTDPDLYYYERSFGGYLALSYPLSKFRRIEASATISNSDKDIYVGLLPRKALLISNSLSFVWDNSLWGPTGPLDGNRMKLTLAYTTDIQYSNVNYYTLIADYRMYNRLSRRSSFASRVNIWYNEGKEARRFFMGGSWDLRGWPRWQIRGAKLWFTSQELRFPFIDELGILFPFGGITLGSIRGAIFADAGKAWDRRYHDSETKGSIGVGVRMNFGGFLVLRYDMGKRIERNFTHLQKGLFSQFFFGWDF
jgi:hypothetical protein